MDDVNLLKKPKRERKQRSITVSQSAWIRVNEVVKKIGAKSVSGMAEGIGKGIYDVSVKEVDPEINEYEIPIYPRIRATLNESSPRFRSLISMIWNSAHALDIVNDKIEASELEALVINILLKAFSCLALEDYIYPNREIYNTTATVRWICWRILLKQAKIEDVREAKADLLDNSKLDNKDSFSEEIWQIFDGILSFKQDPNHLIEFTIFELRLIERMDWLQISKFMTLRGFEVDEHKARDHVRKGLLHLRRCVHESENKSWEESLSIEQREQNKIFDKLYFDKLHPYFDVAQDYLDYFSDLIENKDLDKRKSFINKLEKIIVNAMYYPGIDALIGEIEHISGHKLAKKCIGWCENDQYHEYQHSIRQKVYKRFDSHFRHPLHQLKNLLKGINLSRDTMNGALLRVAEDESGGVNFPLPHFIGSDYPRT